MTTRRSSILAAAVFAAIAFPAVAEARIVDLRLSGIAGGMFGWGTTCSGTRRARASDSRRA